MTAAISVDTVQASATFPGQRSKGDSWSLSSFHLPRFDSKALSHRHGADSRKKPAYFRVFVIRALTLAGLVADNVSHDFVIQLTGSLPPRNGPHVATGMVTTPLRLESHSNGGKAGKLDALGSLKHASRYTDRAAIHLHGWLHELLQ